MDTKLCRICGQVGTNHRDIFKIEGLKHKIETCLPIFVTQHCLLPDTICPDCLENITKFYYFIKNCLQSIIILESQYDITESCLKSKRRHDKSCLVDFSAPTKAQETQTEDTYDILFTKYYEKNSEKIKLPFEGCDINLVDYGIDSDISESENLSQNKGVVVVNSKTRKKVDDVLNDLISKTSFTKQYFDNFENSLISEITHRKGVKRKSNAIENDPPKIFRMDGVNRRKSKDPKKRLNSNNHLISNLQETENKNKSDENQVEVANDQSKNIADMILPQNCLLCDTQLIGPSALAAHIFEVHNLDFNQTLENLSDKKKKIPNLLKISDIKRNSSSDDNQQDYNVTDNTCQICTYSSSTKQELYTHCRTEHPTEVPLMCGICFQPMTSLVNLRNHLRICAIEYPVKTRYFCSVCKYGEDGMREMENHVLIHDFLIDICKKEVKMFDPADYVKLNNSCEHGPVSPTSKNLSCSLCFQSNFQSFKDFSSHRRKQHSKFHCDLCNKFYGRNSHLWKHVNRLHKNHPSITCQICQKTSASKYHLGQHFSKIHSTKQKSNAQGMNVELDNDQFMFSNFNFLKQEKKSTSSEFDEISNNAVSDQEVSDEVFSTNVPVPKEVDASSHLYTNIITNYTPPPNEGDFKCPKCSKGFSKKLLLKKHKKNCRPKMQKDLLTRCKSCARIFKDRQSLAKHLVNYHSEYTCEICSQKSQSKCEIVSHIRFTHPQCKLFCKICGNILRSQQNLADHIKDHSNSYICQFCGDSLPSKIKLKMHILSLHRKILSLSCGICLKLFENQHILRNHVQLVHKNDLRPLTSCTVCGKNYGSKWKTYDHLNKSHGRIFKVCKTCLEIFNTEEELNLHYEEIHCSKNQITSTVKHSQFNSYMKQEIEEVDESESCKEEMDDIEEMDNGNEEIFTNFAPENISATKISLLEKRLIGKKIIKEENTNKTNEDKIKFNTVKTKIAQPKKTMDYPRNEDDLAAQQNSSKRTVYFNSDVPSLCEICFKTWPAKKHLWQHYIRCHKSVAATVCGICLKTNVDYQTLQNHLKQNHPTLLHGQGFGSNFICRICGRYHNASSKLKLHMAIHENFDWSLLENKDEKTTLNGDKQSQRRNEDNETYYESLIEQVECSSNEEEESEDEQKEDKDNISSSEVNEDESESESDSENSNRNEKQNNQQFRSNSSENSVEEIGRFKIDSSYNNQVDRINSNKEYTEIATEFQSTESDESSSDSCSSEDEDMIEGNEDRSNTASSGEVLIVSGLTNSSSNALLVNSMGDSLPFADNGLFRFKTKELDSAVKSISLECDGQVKEDLEIEYCELSIGTPLNDREIESAVGSIL